MKKYQESGEVSNTKREPIAYKVKVEHVNFIIKVVKDNNFITLEEILLKLLTTFKDFSIHRSHLHRLLLDNHITIKLKRHLHTPNKRFGKEIDIKSKQKEFYDEVKKYKLEDIICIDETSISGLLKRNFCYEVKQQVKKFSRNIQVYLLYQPKD